MNQLPDHRRALHARTYGRIWNAADFDPIEAHRGSSRLLRALLYLCLFGLFAGYGVLLAWRG